jgi:hypothetical protein
MYVCIYVCIHIYMYIYIYILMCYALLLRYSSSSRAEHLLLLTYAHVCSRMLTYAAVC